MLAIEIAGFGGPEVLRPVERPVPEPGLNEVRVRVHAAGVNRPDLMQRQGNTRRRPARRTFPASSSPASSRVVGPVLEGEPSRWAPGDSVCALVAGGGYAECAVAPSPQCLPVPAGMTPVSAAAIPETYFTVWTNVFQRGQLATGETILIHGGSSGIGTTAIQLARAFGATVYATAGTDEKCRACERLGAEAAINYKTSDFVDVVSQLTSGRGVNLILDIVGGDYLERNLKTLAIDGRLVQIGLQGGVPREHRPATGDATAADADWLDAPQPLGCRESGDRARPRKARLAAAGVGHGQAGDRPHAAPRSGRRGPPPARVG